MRSLGYGITDIGAKRESNEDFLLADGKLGLYVVCDGMGGHAAGEVAAELAASTAEKVVRAERGVLKQVASGEVEHSALSALARKVVREASSVVYDEASRNSDRAGMGTTMTVLLIAGNKAAMGHVGNSRLYIHRDGAMSVLSTDHTLAAEAVRRGDLTIDQEAKSQLAHVMTRTVGAQKSVEVDSLVFDLHADDRLLLCSDGLTERLESSSELASHLAGEDAKEIPRVLVDLANARGAPDNVTALVVILETSDEEQKQLLELGQEVNRQLDALRGVDIFANVGFADLLRILDTCDVRECGAGELVVQEDDTADRLCIVLEGKFSLEAGDASLRDMDPGDHVGDTTILVRRACRSVLRSVDGGRLLVLSGTRLRELARRRPWLGVAMLLQLGEKVSRELALAGDVLAERVYEGPEEKAKLPRALLSFLTPWR